MFPQARASGLVSVSSPSSHWLRRRFLRLYPGLTSLLASLPSAKRHGRETCCRWSSWSACPCSHTRLRSRRVSYGARPHPPHHVCTIETDHDARAHTRKHNDHDARAHTQTTSPLTTHISGCRKTALQTLLGILIFKNKVSALTVARPLHSLPVPQLSAIPDSLSPSPP